MAREIKFRVWLEIGDNSEIKAMITDEIAVYTETHSGNCGCPMDVFFDAIKEQSGFVYIDGQFHHANIEEGNTVIDAEEFNVYEMDEWFLFDGELMQYTGLKDKNGVEIYEGDILKSDHVKDDSYHKVYWRSERAGYNVERYWPSNKGVTSTDALEATYMYEIIGNIYQNPELLNTKT